MKRQVWYPRNEFEFGVKQSIEQLDPSLRKLAQAEYEKDWQEDCEKAEGRYYVSRLLRPLQAWTDIVGRNVFEQGKPDPFALRLRPEAESEVNFDDEGATILSRVRFEMERNASMDIERKVYWIKMNSVRLEQKPEALNILTSSLLVL